MTYVAQIDMHEISVVPRFKYVTYEDVPQSEIHGYPVMKTREMVEIRFAGNKNYEPCVPVDSFWKRDGHKIMTYAERWPEQYRAFLTGDEQIADGTPLEMLRPFGITPSQLSLCRALKIHSIEALNAIQSEAVKNLGMSGNALKEMAKRYVENRPVTVTQSDELAALRAEIAALKAANVIPADQAKPEEIDAIVPLADEDARKAMLKDQIREKTGITPRGNPSLATLEAMLKDA